MVDQRLGDIEDDATYSLPETMPAGQGRAPCSAHVSVWSLNVGAFAVCLTRTHPVKGPCSPTSRFRVATTGPACSEIPSHPQGGVQEELSLGCEDGGPFGSPAGLGAASRRGFRTRWLPPSTGRVRPARSSPTLGLREALVPRAPCLKPCGCGSTCSAHKHHSECHYHLALP